MAKTFISFSHRDEKALERLHTHLATLRREGKIADWYDREILAGDDIDSTIDSNLALSEIFLALVSPDFLASNYCYEREMTTALERHAEGTLRVVPIILELNEIGDSIRARFERMSDLAFSCTVLNKGNDNREAHITVHADSEAFGGDISYSFSRRASANTANGFIRIEANEYELYLSLDSFSSNRAKDGEILSAEQAADALWRNFTSQAGIDHE